MGAGAIPLQVEKKFFEQLKGKYKFYVYTADMAYEGDDRIDVSANGGYFIFVPPKHLLFDYRFRNITEDQFQKAYFEFLKESYTYHPDTWDAVLSKKRIVLICTCNSKGKACHRYFIVNFLKKMGAVFKGELKF
jgi:hypothetical protein